MPPKQPEQPPRKNSFALVIGIALIASLALAAFATTRAARSAEVIAYSEFMNIVEDNRIAGGLAVNQQEGVIRGAYWKDREKKLGSKAHSFTTNTPSDVSITAYLRNEDMPFYIERSKSSSAAWMILIGAMGIILLLVLMNRSRQGSSKAGSGSPGRMMEAGQVSVTFEDVAGCDEVVAELQEIKDFLADPERFRKLGANIPKGVLLFGPPGTGKTLLARAVAGEAGVPFFSISGSDFVEMYVGVGASRVRKLFEAAKQQAPCVVFIDEIDAVGRRRSGSAQGGQEERENTLNQLLVEIDGFAPTDNVIVMAASNRADILDPALTRPGRFDRQVIVDSPDRRGRLEILRVHGKNKPFDEQVDLESVARQTAGFCGADLANLVNEAALLAARHDRQTITPFDVDEAIMRVIAGPQKNRLISEDEKRVIAAHEIGHAIVAHELPESEPVHKVTIVGRGRALGLMVSLQEDDKHLRSRTELMADMAVALGGRIAEELMFESVTTGAENDLERVNRIAQSMILRYGMSDTFATRALVDMDRSWVHSDTYSSRVDSEIDQVVERARDIASNVLERNRDQLEAMTTILIERETLERDEFERVMRGEALPPVVVDDASGETAEHAPVAVAHVEAGASAADSREADAPTPDITERVGQDAPVEDAAGVAGSDDEQLPAAA